ncbi:MAG: hypothetical protein SFU87_08565 [Chitinophagaceae bacterium]|nr:hypothetical protein [Chitinophagaceae bacterium]
MNKTICLLAVILSLAARGQEYVIHHDMIRETTDYFKVLKQKDTVKVSGISLKKSAKILLEVDNYNPYYWNARVTAFKKPLEEEVSYAGVFNPFSVLGQSLGLSGMLPNLDLPSTKTRAAASNQTNEELAAGSMDAETFMTLNSRFEDAYQKLQGRFDELNLLELQLTELKYETKKTGGEIKTQARMGAKKLFGDEPVNLERIRSLSRDYKQSILRLYDTVNIISSLIQQAGSKFKDSSTRLIKSVRVKDYMKEARDVVNKLEVLMQPDSRSDGIYLQKIAAISKLYGDIINTPFKYSYILNGEPDITELKLEIYPRLDSLSKDTVVKYFPVKSRSNVKIRNSVGITFSYYKDNNLSYFIKPDSTIGEGKGDLFTPVLSTFIHFYGANQSGIKWGGAIGFGIPLQGDKKDINFLLGLSAVLGRNEPVIISAGLSGGKVNTLGGGFQKGDKMPSTTLQLPSRALYKAGAFLSITFNLSNLNLGAKK